MRVFTESLKLGVIFLSKNAEEIKEVCARVGCSLDASVFLSAGALVLSKNADEIEEVRRMGCL